jgi:hypothetical protein
VCCPTNQQQAREALVAGRERELGFRDLIGRLFGRQLRDAPLDRDGASPQQPADGPQAPAI